VKTICQPNSFDFATLDYYIAFLLQLFSNFVMLVLTATVVCISQSKTKINQL